MTDTASHPTTEQSLYPLVVLGEMVIMPMMTVPLQIGQGKSFRALEVAWEAKQNVLLILILDSFQNKILNDKLFQTKF